MRQFYGWVYKNKKLRVLGWMFGLVLGCLVFVPLSWSRVQDRMGSAIFDRSVHAKCPSSDLQLVVTDVLDRNGPFEMWTWMDCSFESQACFVTNQGSGIDATGGDGLGIPDPNIARIDISNLLSMRVEKEATFGCMVFLVGCDGGELKFHRLPPPPLLNATCFDQGLRCVAAQVILTSDNDVYGDARKLIAGVIGDEGSLPRRVAFHPKDQSLNRGFGGGPEPLVALIVQPNLTPPGASLAYNPNVFTGGTQTGRYFIVFYSLGSPTFAHMQLADPSLSPDIEHGSFTRAMRDSVTINLGAVVASATQTFDAAGEPGDGNLFFADNGNPGIVYKQSVSLVSDNGQVTTGVNNIGRLAYDDLNLELWVCGSNRVEVYTDNLTNTAPVFRGGFDVPGCQDLDLDLVNNKVYVLVNPVSIHRYDRDTLQFEASLGTLQNQVLNIDVDFFNQKAYVLSRRGIGFNTSRIQRIDLCSSL